MHCLKFGNELEPIRFEAPWRKETSLKQERGAREGAGGIGRDGEDEELEC